MAQWGLQLFGPNGQLVLDGEMLLHRLWHSFVATSIANYYYPQPLNHEPTVVSYAIVSGTTWGNPHRWEHLRDANGNYIGIRTLAEPLGTDATVFFIFASK